MQRTRIADIVLSADKGEEVRLLLLSRKILSNRRIRLAYEKIHWNNDLEFTLIHVRVAMQLLCDVELEYPHKKQGF